MTQHGKPIWYELATPDTGRASLFYGAVLGWQVVPGQNPAFPYHLAKSGDTMVAGLWQPGADDDVPPGWMIYFTADDLDSATRDAAQAGAGIIKPPTDIPGTGRFAVLADPQGAVFGLLEPDMSAMSDAERARAETTGAFDQNRQGHGNWNELMSSNPEAGYAFYSALLGWARGEAMDMGPLGLYQLVRHNGVDIGAIMALGDDPASNWLPYFGVDDVAVAIGTIKAAGGRVDLGPVEVPGPALIAVATDDQGARFAVVGPKP